MGEKKTITLELDSDHAAVVLASLAVFVKVLDDTDVIVCAAGIISDITKKCEEAGI